MISVIINPNIPTPDEIRAADPGVLDLGMLEIKKVRDIAKTLNAPEMRNKPIARTA